MASSDGFGASAMAMCQESVFCMGLAISPISTHVRRCIVAQSRQEKAQDWALALRGGAVLWLVAKESISVGK